MKNKVLIIVIICVLIIGLIGVGIFSYKKHSNGSKKKGPGWGTPEERGVVIESPEEDFDVTPTMIFSSEEFMDSVINDYGKEGVTYKLTKDIMENALNIDVPLLVDGGFGRDWYSAK